MNDNEILKLLLDKDDTALSELKNAYQHYCFSIAFNILHNYEDAEECVSDTWLRVWNSVPPNHPASLKRYSARITRNLALNRYRDLRTQKCGNGILCHSIEELSECNQSGDGSLIDKDGSTWYTAREVMTNAEESTDTCGEWNLSRYAPGNQLSANL